MAYSFDLSSDSSKKKDSSSKRKVLVTGAAGTIGSCFAHESHAKYQLRLMVRPGENKEPLNSLGEIRECDLSNLKELKSLCEGMDTVVHLAANPSPSATWNDLLNDNIIGTYHLLVAAKAAGCRRVIIASSIHAITGYAPDIQVRANDPVNPGDLYGATKCFSEALGRYMASQENLSVIVIRIGAFCSIDSAKPKESLHMLDVFVSQRDLQQLIEKCISAENVRFAIVHGVSNNRFKRLDISEARELFGYEPQDDFTSENEALKSLELKTNIMSHSQADERQESGIRETLREL